MNAQSLTPLPGISVNEEINVVNKKVKKASINLRPVPKMKYLHCTFLSPLEYYNG